jgi:hypothetical protein
VATVIIASQRMASRHLGYNCLAFSFSTWDDFSIASELFLNTRQDSLQCVQSSTGEMGFLR